MGLHDALAGAAQPLGSEPGLRRWTDAPRPFVGARAATSATAPVTKGRAGGSGPKELTVDEKTVGAGTNAETAHAIDIAGTTVTLATPLLRGHGVGERVERTSGSLVYRDGELPQDVCAAARVARFGKASGPSLVRGGAPFASGLPPKGPLVAATRAARSFYGPPLVAWTPALGASA